MDGKGGSVGWGFLVHSYDGNWNRDVGDWKWSMAPFANIFKLLSTGWNVKLFSKFNELSATGTGWNENLSEVW